jgi:hypothetical protein
MGIAFKVTLSLRSEATFDAEQHQIVHCFAIKPARRRSPRNELPIASVDHERHPHRASVPTRDLEPIRTRAQVPMRAPQSGRTPAPQSFG